MGMMLIEEAHRLGARTVALDPDPAAPAFAISDFKIVARYDDTAALEQLCQKSDVVTYEFENVPGEVLVPLVEKYNIPQGFRPLHDSQDRLREKRNARDHGLRTPEFEAVDDDKSLGEAIRKIGYPCVLKTRTMGYDGHGQALLRSDDDRQNALKLLAAPCILEQYIPFDFEVSIIMVRDSSGRTIHFPVGRNIHRDGILDLCIVPAPMEQAAVDRLVESSRQFMAACGYTGILSIEYFVRGGEFFFNEMAPRPHNSGHYTIEGCTTNQYRELARYLLGDELEEPRLVAPAVMKNILGQDTVAARMIAREAQTGVSVHLYGKSVSRPKRKMGHITFVPLTGEEYDARWRDRFVK